MKKYRSFLFTLLCLAPCFEYPYAVNQIGEPLISIDMESNTNDPAFPFSFFGKDSTTEGISGKARYFSYENKQPGYIQIETNDALTSLWKDDNFSIEIWVQTKAKNQDYQVIASNKDWNSGEIKDFTTNHAFGFSRTSGTNKGWAIICQPDGSWAWNIGNGKYRLDYRPTSPRQQINDGAWHQIVFTMSRQLKEARLYFDGRNVAIYNTGGLNDVDSNLPVRLATDAMGTVSVPSFEGALDEFHIYNYVLDASSVAEKYKKLVPAARLPELAKEPVKTLNLMAWNIWHGGRRHGREIGPQQVIDFIKDTGTDIVMMQETYGSGALIADALGYYFYLASTNISVMSKYPIAETKAPYDAFRLGFTSIQLSQNQKINLASLWIHYLPAWRNDSNDPQATAEKLIAGEGKTRHKEIKEIIALLQPEINKADETPLIIGGDFNSPSHKDWGGETKDWHNGLIVEWPVSKVMTSAGFKDSFREIRSDLNYESATMTPKRLTYRIDYIYYIGEKLQAIDSDMHFKYKGIWPSDHPAVTTTLLLK
ncbi:endonuclease/exonuclease/phosphatase family protein [Fulvivirgaceae bacterium BMA10]|uniref:Endonuclease/exonuclease/phosphatase family protein n=1 Tax=Splendidivirga corallicola TaxID=3051826 RepID=A0ABT8KK14_9BACT|nr:endonuclease/exonuclease/phosphatase family protein [Fulvivirgaceae bacterium BMA10]